MKNQYKIINYKNKEYIVATTNKNEPFIFDKEKLKDLPDVLCYLHNTYIYYYTLNYKNSLHSLIMNYKFNGELYVDHINRITTDNRCSNLRLISQSDQNKNQSKQTRNVVLPLLCNINPQDIPTFVWYIKVNGNHGDRWAVEIKGKYFWKTTSTKTLSTKCKFELAKKHLKNLIDLQPKLFIGHCMNGELSSIGKQLEKEYIDILHLAGYNYNINDNLKNYLQEDLNGLSEDEVKFINEFENINNDIKIPKYCYYIKSNDKKGDGYCITRLHPKQKESGKDWTTTKSKKVSTKEKYKQMTEYLNNNIYKPKEDIIIEKTLKKNKQIIPEDKFNLLESQQLIDIIKMKNQDKTTQEVSDYIKKNFNIYINRNFISRLWLGEDLKLSPDILNSQEYQAMKLNTKQNTVKSKKFDKKELEWILTYNLDKSLGQRVILFQKRYNKTITKAYLSKLKYKFEYIKSDKLYDNININQNVKSVTFDISRYHKYKETITFNINTSIIKAIERVEEYLSKEINEEYFNKIKNDNYENYKHTDFKYRGQVLSVYF